MSDAPDSSANDPGEGLIHACVLDGRGGHRRIAWDEVSRWMPEDGLLWLHLDYTHPGVQGWLRDHSGLDPLASEALIAEETRPRAVALGDGMLVSLRGVNLNPGADPEDMVAIRLWVSRNRIITTRKRRLLSVADIVEELERNAGPRNAGELVVELADRLIRRMAGVIDHAEDEVAALEESVLTEESHELRNELAAVRRQAIALRRYLAPQREALARLQAEPPEWLAEHDRMRLRETGDRLTRYIEDLNAVRESAAVTQEELTTRLSDQLNRRMYVLSVVAAIFLPLGFFTGLLGVNVGGIPGAEDPWAFGIFVLVLLLGVGVQVWLFRIKRWL